MKNIYDAQSLDIGEKGTQRIIAEMLWDHHERDASLSLNVLDHEDTLDFLVSEKYFDARWNRITKRCRLVWALPLLKL